MRELGTPCLIHQPYYNMFGRWIEDGLTAVLDQEGIGCIPFSPLAQGMLTNRYLDGIPADLRAGQGVFFLKPKDVTEEKVAKVRKLERPGPGARADAGADGPGLGAAPAAGDLGA